MVGIVVCAHFNLAKEMVLATELIAGKQDQIWYVNVNPEVDMEKVRMELERAIKEVDSGEGVIIFTDMFGGTPCNISLSFLEKGRIEVITGVNLPMLIKTVLEREGKKLDELAETVKDYGQKHIYLARDLLK
ncbi:MAG: PTS sugar transporter subunit IIA [Desulfobacterota bacterium]|nr:PTS sugar transporter subunit IIA [Thermodesulfobacteriota bacterium]MDW8001943.1 PTS sugar transporter subunit IIA [Deltaproteobacteria bacterium]